MDELIRFATDHPLVMLTLGIVVVLYTLHKFNQLH